jgi:HEAT repeat protein
VVTELAFLGSSGDHELILGALDSEDVATRREAVNAVRWIGGERIVELLTPRLWDPSAGVTSTAATRLSRVARDLDGGMLLELAAAPSPHNRRVAYRLLRRRAPWDRIEANLMALADIDDHVRRDALVDLRSWLHRGAASAPRADLPTRRRLSQRLDTVEHLLQPHDVAAIRFHVGLRKQDLRG